MAQYVGPAGEKMVLAVLGCGSLGTAILSGILSSLQSPTSTSSNTEDFPNRLPSKFVACVRSPQSVKRIESTLSEFSSSLSIVRNDNVSAVEAADIIILGCKPYMASDILSAPGIKDALKGKLLISILAGVPVSQISNILYSDSEPECTIVRAMPNVAASIRESSTTLCSSEPLEADVTSLLTWIFTRIGTVSFIPPHLMDVSTALCGSGPAFFALVLEAATDGAVAMGLPRAEAQKMAAQTMKGAAGLVLEGEHPALLREKVGTPGGCTIGGLLVLEEGNVRGTVSRAVREATCVASQLGKGVQGVNGTRF